MSDATVVVLALVLGVVMATCGGCISHAIRADRMVRSIDDQAAAAVKIEATCEKSKGTGSGVIIDSTHVLTAFHVAGCKDATAKIITASGAEYESKVDAYSLSGDIARLKIKGSFGFVPRTAVGFVHVGDSIAFEAACPHRVRTTGEMKWSNRPAPGNMKHTAITIPGNSGSGVYNARGQLVGIVTHMSCTETDDVRTCDGGLATSLAEREWLVPR